MEFIGVGGEMTPKSAALLFVSCPSTRRAALDWDGGAEVGEPSTNAFVALPQPTESTTRPAGSRSARPPPDHACGDPMFDGVDRFLSLERSKECERRLRERRDGKQDPARRRRQPRQL